MRILFLIMLFVSSTVFSFEEHEDYEEEMQNQKIEKEKKQSQQRNYQEENQLQKQQRPKKLLRQQNSTWKQLQQDGEE